mgnify:CR=1 FL=1
MKTLVILENGQELTRIDGTFLAAYPSSSGISVTVEGDFTPIAKAAQPYLQQLLAMFMAGKKTP